MAGEICREIDAGIARYNRSVREINDKFKASTAQTAVGAVGGGLGLLVPALAPFLGPIVPLAALTKLGYDAPQCSTRRCVVILAPSENGQYAGELRMTDSDIRAALSQHWAASDANDFELEHQIYREDAVLEYPQSGERIRGRRNIQITRTLQPSRKRFKVRRVIGAGDLWVTEYVILYDGQPSYTVSIMEFEGGQVARETQYFGDPFEASAWRSRWVEPMEKEGSLP